MRNGQLVQRYKDLVLIEEFIRRGARVPIIKGMFPHIPDQPIREIYHSIVGQGSRRGLNPDSAISICPRHDQILNANTFFLIYKSLGGNDIFDTTNPETLIEAYDQYVALRTKDNNSLDFIGACYVARDVRARILETRFCRQCGVEHLYAIINESWHMCPYCRTARRGKGRGKRARREMKKLKSVN